MNCKGDSGCSTDSLEPGDEGRSKGKVAAVAKAFRAANAIVVFGFPLLVGTAALIAYGAHKVCKRMIRN